MKHPDPREIPTLNDLVFPSDRSAMSHQPTSRSSPIESPLPDQGSQESIEARQQNEPLQEEKRLEPHFLVNGSSDTTEVFAFEAEPSLPIFGGEEPERSAPSFRKTDAQSDKPDPSFGSFVRIHSLAEEEFTIPFIAAPSPPVQQGTGDPVTRDTANIPPATAGKIPAPDVSHEPLPPSPEKSPTIPLGTEELVASIEATVRRAVDAEVEQLTKRVTAEVLRVLEITLR